MMVGENGAGTVTVVGLIQLNNGTTWDQVKTLRFAHSVADGTALGTIIDDTGNFITAPNGDYYCEWYLTDTNNDESSFKYPVLYVDVNGDGKYTSGTDKPTVFDRFPFRTVWRSSYNYNYNLVYSKVNGGNTMTFGYGFQLTTKLVNAFLNNGVVNQSDITSGTFRGGNFEPFYPNAPRVTHNVGVVWQSPTPNNPGYYVGGAVGQIRRWTIPANGDPQNWAYYTTRDNSFTQMVSAMLKTHLNEVGAVFNAPGAPNSKQFGPWLLPNALTFQGIDLRFSINNASLHNVNQPGDLMACYVGLKNDTNWTIVNLVLQGYLEDVNDYDYDSTGKWYTGNPAQSAAIVQTGYGTIGNSGAIFKLQINYDGLDIASPLGPDGSAGPFNGQAMKTLP